MFAEEVEKLLNEHNIEITELTPGNHVYAIVVDLNGVSMERARYYCVMLKALFEDNNIKVIIIPRVDGGIRDLEFFKLGADKEE